MRGRPQTAVAAWPQRYHRSPSRSQRVERPEWPYRRHLRGKGCMKAAERGGNGARAASGAWYQSRLEPHPTMLRRWSLHAWPPLRRKRAALPLKQSPFAISTFSSSAERKLRERRKKVPTIASQLICERAGAVAATCSDRLEASQWTCSVDLCDALRPQTYKRADIVHPICDMRACYQSERSTHLPGCAIRAT